MISWLKMAAIVASSLSRPDLRPTVNSPIMENRPTTVMAMAKTTSTRLKALGKRRGLGRSLLMECILA
jgi:hypothetical protein